MDMPVSGLCGDYQGARVDYTIDQDHAAYGAEEHLRWCALYQRQSALARERAVPSFLQALDRLGCGEAIPDLARVSERLDAASGWRLVGVPGLIPDRVFFEHLAARRFPVTTWLRQPRERDYLVEPDIFHDFFGHVPMLMDREIGRFMQAYGRAGIEADEAGVLKPLARLYWYTIEFGLMATRQGLRAFGAGLLSSPAELRHALEDARPRRVRFDRQRVLESDYRIDDFQATYFVLDDVETLAEALAGDLIGRCRVAASQPPIGAASRLATDRLVFVDQPDRATHARAA